MFDRVGLTLSHTEYLPAACVLHDQIDFAARLHDLVQPDDMLMRQQLHDLHLAADLDQAVFVKLALVNNLDGHLCIIVTC